MKFGPTLKAARLRLSVTSVQLAELTGWSKVHIHRIERQENVSETTIARYCEALGLEPRLVLNPESKLT